MNLPLHQRQSMNSVELCQYWLQNGALFLDTETTGVDETAEIVEIAVINHEGCPVYESLIRPKVPITPELTAIHGINNEMVDDSTEVECESCGGKGY